ncbi:hypothetical protein PIB30_025369 [Stylosanthes scabra]|uniref:Uncharacterized protein n=1 Tax=Stylosanthes scabra TaxID=79078 RepID=A0ABU6ZAD6_9FABA|nr:hypothetical protein [Stylosanthes scabra]
MKSQDSRCSPTAIAEIFLKLRYSKDLTKYREVEDMGFGCLKHIPRWKMRQDMAVALARSYNNEKMSMMLETGGVPVTALLIGSALGLPAKGDGFKELDENVHQDLIDTYEGMTVSKLKELVINCSVSTASQKEDFRCYFILFVMKNFLFPTSDKTTTKAHLPSIIDGLIRKIQEWCKSEREKSSKNDTPNRAPYKRRRVQVKFQTGAQKRNSSNKNVVHADERESSSDSHTSDEEWYHQEQQSPPSRANISERSPRVGVPSNSKVHQESSINKSSTKREKGTINETPNGAPNKRKCVQVKPQTRGLKQKSSNINVLKSGERESSSDSHTSEAVPCHQEQPSPPSRVNMNANSPQARAPSDNKVHQEGQV